MTDTWFDNGVVQLYQADARSLPIPDNSVDCVVTSPPYWGLRDYGIEEQGIGLEPTPEEYCANMVAVFREVWRVLKPTGTLWLNLGDSYAGSHGTGGNPGDKQYTQAGSRSVNGRPDVPIGLKPKDLVGIPWRVAFALQADGWYLRSDIIWSKPNPMPESVTDRPTKAHEYVFLLTKSPRYYYDQEAVRESSTTPFHIDNSHRPKEYRNEGRDRPGRNRRSVWEITTQPYPEAHFATYPEKLVEPCILAGTSEKGVCAVCGKPWERIVEKVASTMNIRVRDAKKGILNKKSGVNDLYTATISEIENYGREHMGATNTKGWQPTCDCNANTVPATVLDPFAGSGTTLAVAQRLGRRAIGTDLSAEYLDLAAKRLGRVALPMVF